MGVPVPPPELRFVPFEPGPWHVVGPVGTAGWGLCVSANRAIVARMTGPQGATKQANARLMAAAPTLLEACAGLTEWWQMLPKDTRLPDHDLALEAIRVARRAINAIRGVSS